MSRAELNQLRCPIEADHLAEMIAEMAPMRLGEVVELVLGGIHASRRDDMQQRLPQVGAASLDESDIGESALPEFAPETADELETRRSAADDDDSAAMMVAPRRRHEI